MSGFGFGTGSSNSAPGSSVLFGANKVQTTTSGFSLGGATTSTPGTLFGAANTQPSGLTFGSPATTMVSGLTFGTTPSAQANTGLSFGTSTLGQTSGLSFGSPAPSATTTSGLFGTTPASSTGLSFGTSPSTQLGGQTGLSFGQPATSTAQPGLSFGATTTNQSTGVSFGSVGGSTATGLSGMTFGTPVAAVAPTVAAPATSTQAGFSFGSNTQTTSVFGATSSAPSTGLNFGGPTAVATATGLTFGTATSTPSTGLTFGTVPTSTSLGSTAPSTFATKPLSLPFGTPPTGSTGLNLSLPSTSQPTGFNLGGTSLLGGLNTSKPLTLGQAPANTSTSLNFGGSTLPVSTTTTPSIGLGGIDSSQNKAGQAGTIAGKSDRAVKENQIPNEITQTIDGFKSFVKTQKSLSSDIARGSAKPLCKVQEDTESLRQMLTTIKSGLQRNKALADRLKADTAKSIHDAEMAQRTHDTPPGLQYDNTAPLEYFSNLVSSFENEMQKFRQEIENAEKHLQSLSEPIALTPQELSQTMKHLHDSFVALAGRLQTVHNSVEAQKEQYLNLRKYFLKDPTNVFEEARKSNVNTMKPIVPTRISLGPTPFSPMGNQHKFGLIPVASTEPTSSFPTGKSLGWGGTNLQLPTSNMNTNFSGGLSSFSSLPVENQGFQLQKPPLGNKRGKR